MKQKRTRFETLNSRIRNNPIAVLLIVLGTIVIALSTFTDATKNLLNLISKPTVININGGWVSQEITNHWSQRDKFRLYFDFDCKGNTLLGAVRMESTTNRYNVIDGILGGSIKDNIISFYIIKQYRQGGSDELFTYKNFYYGTVLKDEIEFVLQSDYPGSPPQKFTAKPE